MKDNIDFNIENNSIKNNKKEYFSITFLLFIIFIILSCVYTTFYLWEII